MTFNRNYAAVPQTPTAPGYTPIPINQQAKNSFPLGVPQLVPLASEQVLINPTVAAPMPLVLTIPSKSLIEGQPFEILASGDIFVGGATPTALMKLYSGTSMTLANNLLLAATAAAALPTANTPFWFRATLIGSTSTGKIYGTFESLFGATWGAKAAIAAPIPNVNFKSDPAASLMLTLTPSNANANSSITLYEYAVNFG